MTWRLAAEMAAFNLVWWTCALGAARGLNGPGVCAAGLFVVGQWLLRQRSPALLTSVLVSGIFGLAADSALAWSGLFRYAAPWPHGNLAPAWIVALWLAFGALVPPLAQLLAGTSNRFRLALGAAMGPLAYLAGDALGALSAPPENWIGASWIGYLAAAVIWGAALPLLLALWKRRAAAAP